jgi:dTDP-4-amino-4,6-dideoxygalactose transaminase
MVRRQLPAYSPITLGGIGRGLLHGARLTPDGRGPLAQRLMRDLAADAARLYGSGTQALRAAIELARRRLGAETIALPAFTCFDVAAAAVATGGKIALYDVDPETLSPDLDTLRDVLNRGAQVVVVSPLYGYPVDWDASAAEVARAGAVVIEDAAQGQFAKWRGCPLGSLGPLSVLSFGRSKGWTGGGGGALLLRGEWAAAPAEDPPPPAGGVGAEIQGLLRLTAQWLLGRPELYAVPAAIPWLQLGETVYRDAPPTRALTRAAAGSLDAHRVPSEREAAIRRENARTILEDLPQGSVVRPVRALPGATPGYLRLPLRLSRGLAGFARPARALRLGLAASYPTVLAEIPEVRERLVTGMANRWPGGERIARTLVTAPTHSLTTDAERQAILAILATYRA